MGSPLGELGAYEVRHLVEHLLLTGAGDSVDRLLALEETVGAADPVNSWFAAHERINDVDGYLADLRRAAELAATGPAIVRYSRPAQYALMAASVRSAVSSLPPELLAAAPRTGAL